MISSNNLKPDPEFIASFRKWTMEEGGMPTFEAFSALNEEMREGILDYFDEMFPYDEISVDSRSYFLCHAGIAGYSAGKPLEDYYEEDFYTFGINSERKYFPDKTIVVGHKPTTEFNDACIYKTTAYINVDCGCAFDGRLACLCLDNGREFYV
jgi:serine/threonine protein phosphatase 1